MHLRAARPLGSADAGAGAVVLMSRPRGYFGLPRDVVLFAAYPAYVAVLAMLVVVEAIGAVGGGSQRWIDLGFMQLQPSEFMKPTIVLALATFYNSLPPGMTGTWRALVPPGVLIGMPMGLVLLHV